MTPARRSAIGAAGVAVGLAGAVAAMAVVTVDSDVRALVTLTIVAGAAGVVLVGAAVLSGWAGAVIGGVACLGVAYATAVAAGDRAADLRSPIVAAALFFIAEATLWSHDGRRVDEEAARVVAGRVAWLAGVTAVSVAGGTGLLAVGAVELGGGVAAMTVGVVAAVGLAAVGAFAVFGSGRRG
jgi:hypothetical protein